MLDVQIEDQANRVKITTTKLPPGAMDKIKKETRKAKTISGLDEISKGISDDL